MKLYQGLGVDINVVIIDTETLQKLAGEIADELNRRQCVMLYTPEERRAFWRLVAQEDGMIAAVTQYRRIHNCSLMEAKQMIDSFVKL